MYVDGTLIDAAVPEGPLSARIQVNGQNASCGACGTVLAQVQGGKKPYQYKWSDPTLEGPGPHSVCPSKTTTYSVEVTDSSERVSVELGAAAQTAQDSVEFACSEDAGIWGGCYPPPPADAGAPAPQVCRTMTFKDPILGLELAKDVPLSFASPIDEGAFTPGKVYEFIYDQLLLTVSFTTPVTVKIYGSDSPCGTDQLFGTWTLDGRPHQGYCFTPEKAWHYTRVDVDIGDTLLYVDFIPAQGTLCRGCESPSP